MNIFRHRMDRKKTSILFLVILVYLYAGYSVQAQAILFGLKSCGSGSSGFCGSGTIPDSLPPTNLFSFQDDGTGFIDIGAVKRGGNDIDADGLAFSQTEGLFAFELQKSGTATIGSTLITIDPGTGLAAGVGPILSGRDIRGAVFNRSDSLFAIDAANDEFLQINPATGAVFGAPLELTLGGSPFDLSDVSDIAVQGNGAFFLSNASEIYTVDIQSGALSLVHTDSLQGFAGVAFAEGAASDALFAFDVNGFEDVFRENVDSGFAQTILFSNIIPSFNAGRGDLAATPPIPEPSTLILLLLSIPLLSVRKLWN